MSIGESSAGLSQQEMMPLPRGGPIEEASPHSRGLLHAMRVTRCIEVDPRTLIILVDKYNAGVREAKLDFH